MNDDGKIIVMMIFILLIILPYLTIITLILMIVPNFQADVNLVDQLTMMGFSENGCKRAAIATKNGAIDIAMNWILEHMDDPDFNDAPPSSSSSSQPSSASSLHINNEAIDMLVSMGYSEDQTKAALIATDQDIERAADWLFSHVDDLDYAVAQVIQLFIVKCICG